MPLAKGQPAPNFSLIDSTKQKITLSEQRGNIVLLLFVPAAFTGTCTKEMCSTSDDLNYYNNLNCKVFGISTDSIFVLAKWKEEQKIAFPLLADYNKEVTKLYGVNYTEFVHGMKGTSKRSAFVIDKNGMVKYAEVLESAGDIPDFGKIKSVINDLVF
ncbi:MAG TPA: redoxin domain-containing protein [Bacteroidia bacterium]|nr:redoxin domain-containing protein [Bacteroidia bacterium]HNU33480.1 redoxin domain-containing protein [Bacteroidia bacterium]